MMTIPLLDASRVSKSFAGVQAVAPADFAVQRGEFVSLVGPSGCGKTTMLRMCAGLLAPTTGQVEYDGSGHAITPGTYGFVFQQAALLDWRTVEQNLVLPIQLLGLSKKAATPRIDRLLAQVGLEQARHRLPAELSGGMQQRASIARALVHDPDVLFMDEPFGALDAFTRETLNDDLAELHEKLGKTILFVTHDIDEAAYLSDRVLVMAAHPGRLVEVRTVDLPRPRNRESDALRDEVRAIRSVFSHSRSMQEVSS